MKDIRKILIPAGAAALFAGCFYAAKPRLIGRYAFNFIFKRDDSPREIPEDYKKSPHYKVSRAGMAVMEGFPCEEVEINSFDGTELCALYYPAPEEKGEKKKFLLGIHGYRSAPKPEYGPYAEFYRDNGYNLLLPFNRGNIKSGGDCAAMGVLERLDCVEWAKYLVRTRGEDIEIVIHGVSMGGAAVLAASGEAELPPQVKGIVSDCGFTSAYEVLEHQIGTARRIKANPGRIMPVLNRICKKKGFDLKAGTPVDLIKKAKVPILIVHGEEDALVPPSMAKRLFDACGSGKKRLLMVPGAGHAESIAIAPEEYYRAIRETIFE